MTTSVVLVTGHPATGKSTLARRLAADLGMPLVWKDGIKETLLNALGSDSDDWSRRLSVAAWDLLYRQVEDLLRAGVAHVAEANFDPTYANQRWQQLAETYPLQLIQVRCEADPEALIRRYRARVRSGERHPGHVDQSDDQAFLAMLRAGPMDWVEVAGPRLRVDTTDPAALNRPALLAAIRDGLRQAGSLPAGLPTKGNHFA